MKTISDTYGNRIRVRVCGVCIQDNKILMAEHAGLNSSNSFWCPVGGGIEQGETAEEALIREFKEETGLEIKVGKYLFLNEFIQSPFHAIELFFAVQVIGGTLVTGNDPELNLIKQIKWLGQEEISALDEKEIHNSFSFANSNRFFQVQLAPFSKEAKFGNRHTTYQPRI